MVFQFKSSQLNTFILEYFAGYHVIPNVIFYANQLTTITSFVREGLAVGFLPPEIIEKDPDIVQYHLPEAENLENVEINFVYKKKTLDGGRASSASSAHTLIWFKEQKNGEKINKKYINRP